MLDYKGLRAIWKDFDHPTIQKLIDECEDKDMSVKDCVDKIRMIAFPEEE